LRVPNVHVSIDRWQSILAIIDNLKTKNTQFPAPPLLPSPISLQSPMLSSESSSAVRVSGCIDIQYFDASLESFNRPHFSSPPARSRKRKSHMVSEYKSLRKIKIHHPTMQHSHCPCYPRSKWTYVQSTSPKHSRETFTGLLCRMYLAFAVQVTLITILRIVLGSDLTIRPLLPFTFCNSKSGKAPSEGSAMSSLVASRCFLSAP
jgi:hypothetical protein